VEFHKAVFQIHFFFCYLNELLFWIKCDMKMFADDTKLWCRISTIADSRVLQEDLDSLHLWSDAWQLKFNADKCKVMNIGHSFQTKYYIGEGSGRKELESVHQERDLGLDTRKFFFSQRVVNGWNSLSWSSSNSHKFNIG